MIETRVATQPKIAQPKYEKAATSVPKEKVPFARAEPHPNQREVFLALHANGNLPKLKPMKLAMAEAHRGSM